MALLLLEWGGKERAGGRKVVFTCWFTSQMPGPVAEICSWKLNPDLYMSDRDPTS